MRRLDQFAGFRILPQNQGKLFNPFLNEEPPEPKRTEDVVAMIEKEKKKMVNVLDSPAQIMNEKNDDGNDKDKDKSPLTLFPQAKVDKQPLPQQAIVPMDQPRAKDGTRLLYKHPKLPHIYLKGQTGPKQAYFLLVGHSDRSDAAWLLQFDGAANPNPGPASSGAVLWSPKDFDGKRTPVFEMGKYLGKATNNIAEAQGMLLGLKMAAMRGARELLIEGDSELVIFQHIGKYRVSDKNIKVWWSEAQAAMMDESAFDWIAIRQVPREQNERADSITKEVLARKEGFQRTSSMT
jgi:ribonuclease HI